MNREGRSIPDAETIPAASVGDVMVDQFAYLIGHWEQRDKCSPGCRDCARLAHVRAWLLQPFQSTRPAWMAEKVKARAA